MEVKAYVITLEATKVDTTSRYDCKFAEMLCLLPPFRSNSFTLDNREIHLSPQGIMLVLSSPHFHRQIWFSIF